MDTTRQREILDDQVARGSALVLALLREAGLPSSSPAEVSRSVRTVLTGQPDAVLTEGYENAIRLVSGQPTLKIHDPHLSLKSRARDARDLVELRGRLGNFLRTSSRERKPAMLSFGFDADAMGAAKTSLKAASIKLQTALVLLGKATSDSALGIKVDGAVGPITQTAVNRAFTTHIGPGQADAKWRTGKLTVAEIKTNLDTLTKLIEGETARRQTGAYQTTTTAPATGATSALAAGGTKQAQQYLDQRLKSIMATASQLGTRIAALPSEAQSVKSEWAAFKKGFDAWAGKKFIVPGGTMASVKDAIAKRDKEISAYIARLNGFTRALSATYAVKPSTIPAALRPATTAVKTPVKTPVKTSVKTPVKQPIKKPIKRTVIPPVPPVPPKPPKPAAKDNTMLYIAGGAGLLLGIALLVMGKKGGSSGSSGEKAKSTTRTKYIVAAPARR